MFELLCKPWPWYVAGILIGLTVPALLLSGNKPFGISSSLRHICAACIPSGLSYFKYDWKKEKWNLFFVSGVLVGGFIAANFLKNPEPVQVAVNTKTFLQEHQVRDFSSLLPADIFSWRNILSLRGFIFIVLGGFLTGFGTRYAGGCTSGHAIMGLSNLQWPSLVATISFMLGGIFVSWFLLPWLLSL